MATSLNLDYRWKYIVFCGSCAIVILVFYPMLYSRYTTEDFGSRANPLVSRVQTLKQLNFQTFDEWLFSSRKYFDELTYRLREKHIKIEGHIFTAEKDGTFERRPQIEAYYNYITNHKHEINRVCEIGFNGGHSTLLWSLMFNGQIEIISFDLCKSKNCKVGIEIIKEIVPNTNIRLVRGDSTKTVPDFHKNNPDLKCEFLSVDGGHEGKVPTLDLLNMKQLAAKNHLLVMDDVNSNATAIWIKVPGIAWENALKTNLVCPIDTCKTVYTHPENYPEWPIRYCFGRYC